MKVLVTGGAGFFASHLCERLVLQGHEVVCLDNFFTWCRDNVRQLLDYRSFELLGHDVCEPLLLQVDQVYNLACPASPVHYQYNPIKTVKSNVMGTVNILVLAPAGDFPFIERRRAFTEAGTWTDRPAV